MPIGIADEHEDLRLSLRRWIESRCPPEVTRAALDGDKDELPPFWPELAERGWLSVHIAEDLGGQGAGLVELAVVLEELGAPPLPGPGHRPHWPRRSSPPSATEPKPGRSCLSWPTGRFPPPWSCRSPRPAVRPWRGPG